MTKIDIISGFLGAGKTSLIRKMLKEVFVKEKVVLIENEFGEIGIDGGFLKDSGIEIREMNSGCICCSLVGDFDKSLKEVIETYHPDRILIEPSGVGKLSDVIKAVHNVQTQLDVRLNSYTTVVDVTKCRLYRNNFGEFFSNQVKYAKAIILSRTDKSKTEKVEESIQILRELNKKAPIITTPISELPGERLLDTMEQGKSLEQELLSEMAGSQAVGIHEHGEGCGCGEHHKHGEGCGCEEHHKHGEGCGCGEHHEHGDGGSGCHEHHHDQENHHAEEVFTSWGRETAKVYTRAEIKGILKALDSDNSLGVILRAKGMVVGQGEWIYFNMVPGEHQVRSGSPEYTSRICVIGSRLEEQKLAELFKIS